MICESSLNVEILLFHSSNNNPSTHPHLKRQINNPPYSLGKLTEQLVSSLEIATATFRHLLARGGVIVYAESAPWALPSGFIVWTLF